MPVISDAQIAAYARQAGVSGGNVAIAVAVALAESGGNTNAHNPIPPDNSFGLWQINMLGSLGTERRRAWNLASNEELYNPAVNATAMVRVSGGGTNWRPWTTYTSGKYRTYISRGENAAGTKETPSGVSNLGLPGFGDSPFKNLEKWLEWITDPGVWTRVGLAIAGVVLLILGAARLGGAKPETVAKVAKLVVTRKVSK